MKAQTSNQSPILVTGGTGYIASWLIRFLLEDGHTVHATVRNPASKDSVAHLWKLAEGAPGELHLFSADLLRGGSFDDAMKGCEIVIHTASPFVLDGFTDANEALVRPAVEGTRNVLGSVNRTPEVKRVVLTSSVVSVYGDTIDARDIPDNLMDETQWNTSSSVNHSPYNFSKVEAEKEAWKMQQRQDRWEWVTINPGMVYGPSLTTKSQSASIDTLISMADGRLKTGVPDLTSAFVDVRDVARAHVLAAFSSSAEGRYLLVAREATLLDMAKVLRENFGKSHPFPKSQVPKWIVWLFGPLMGPVTRKFVSRNVGHPIRFDNSRSRALGVQYRSMEETLTEHFQQLMKDGLVSGAGE